MTAPADDGTPKLSRLEVLGAWLGVWTPPRDARIPPVPWRRIGWTAIAVAVVAGAGLAVAIPAIDASKDERAATERAAREERAERRRARLVAEQRPRIGRLEQAGAAAALEAVGAAIGRDARERFSRRAAAATCEPAPGVDVAARRVAYDCVSEVREIVGAGDQAGARGSLGIPYRAVLDHARGRYAFCKVNPPPGEQVIPDPRELVELPRACRA